jgi:hypothetical protein
MARIKDDELFPAPTTPSEADVQADGPVDAEPPAEDAQEATEAVPVAPAVVHGAPEAIGYPSRPDSIRSDEDTKAAEGR